MTGSQALSATPYLCVPGAAAAIDFYKTAFGAKEETRFTDTDGRIGHAELRIGAASLMLADSYAEMEALGVRPAAALGGSPVHFFITAADVDRMAAQACEAGAILAEAAEDNPLAGKRCRVRDPYGLLWTITAATS